MIVDQSVLQQSCLMKRKYTAGYCQHTLHKKKKKKKKIVSKEMMRDSMPRDQATEWSGVECKRVEDQELTPGGLRTRDQIWRTDSCLA